MDKFSNETSPIQYHSKISFPVSVLMRRNFVFIFCALTGIFLWNSCASTGTPGGGPKDEIPPKILKSDPLPNQIYFSKKRVELFFDELVSLVNPSEKVIVSPPQKISPTIKAIGNKITVLLADSLLPSTTYTIDFTDAIVDYNEKNKFGDFAFSFSTGNQIDSLRISGTLVDASNLNPVSDVIIGVHSDLNDSTFMKIPFSRISKSNMQGFFTVKGLPKTNFHVYALGDKNKDYHFDQPGESIAYLDSVFTPWTEPCLRSDTTWKDSITIDTIVVKNITCYKPDDLVLRYFTEDFGRQYLSKRERPARERLFFCFGYKSNTLPNLRLINSNAKNWFTLEKNPTKDTLTYWISDTLVSQMDTLCVQLDYFKTDSLNKLTPTTDTLNLISRSFRSKVNNPEKKKKKESDTLSVVPVSHLNYKSDFQGTMDVFSIPVIQWDTPIREVIGEPWSLYKKKDTTWIKTPFTFIKDSMKIRDYILQAKWEFGTEYRFDIDSGMVVGLYGKTNAKFSQSFKIRTEEEYSRLIVSVNGITGSGFVEVLDKTDKVLRRQRIVQNQADIKYLMPGSYYIRAVEDLNNNFQWDTGNYAKKLQPEKVFYNPRILTLRANWDVEEIWNVNEVPLLLQKPKELKPKEKK